MRIRAGDWWRMCVTRLGCQVSLGLSGVFENAIAPHTLADVARVTRLLTVHCAVQLVRCLHTPQQLIPA